MTREHFIHLVEEVLDSIPTEFRQTIHNLAVLVRIDRGRPRDPLDTPLISVPPNPDCCLEFSREYPQPRQACSTSPRHRTASSFTRTISKRSAGTKQKSVMKSGRPFSTNWDTTLG